MAKAKKKTKKKAKKAPRTISLKKTVADLESVTKSLAKVRDKVEGAEREQLTLKIESLSRVREELVAGCHGYLLWPIPPGS